MDCFNCRGNADLDALPAREDITRTTHWRVAHAFDSSLPGWLVVVPLTHVTALDELPPEAHAELGTLLGRMSAALREVVGCVKTYVMQFSEADGFAHLHVHLVPRMPDQPDELKGPAVFGYLGAAEGERVSEAERDRLAQALREALAVG
ncbi:HIT family protein [Nocardioides sp. DS6]|uniref:HIT family protein n=1 Tax=Nocardioides eburneus TaxID=3231482 RepID=A0ABV3SXC8_9ACTN